MPTYTSRLGLPLPLGTEFHNLENYKALINMIDSKASSKAEFDTHANNKSNPHGVTAAQVGLGNVLNVAQYSKTQVDGLINGIKNALHLGQYTKSVTDSINTYPLGTSVTFVRADEGWAGYGTVVTFKGNNINAGGGSLQIYSPYNTETGHYGGKSVKYRTTLYVDSAPDGMPWGPWKDVATTDGNVATATKLQTARTIAGVAFDGTSNISIPAGNVGAYTKAEVDSRIATTVGGNVASATKLQTARTINGVAFDGTSNINILSNPEVTTIPVNADLNDYPQAGFYGCPVSANVATLKNCPTTVAFTMITLAGNTSSDPSICTQIISEYGTGAGSKLYIRRKYSGSGTPWGSWYPIGTADGTLQNGLYAQTASRLATARAITLTGGVTGSATFDGTSTTTISTTITGNAPTATTATKLQTARTIALTGGVTGSTTFDGSGNVSIAATVAGNAPSATKLATARTINGVAFDGTADITVQAQPELTIIANNQDLNTMTKRGHYCCQANITAQTLKNSPTANAFNMITLGRDESGIQTQILTEYMISAGSRTFIRKRYVVEGWGDWYPIAVGDGTMQSGLYAQTASRLATARAITLTGGVTGSATFDGTSTTTISTTITGNAPTATTATKLQTARTIALTGGVTGSTTFDGSGNVSIAATVAGNAPSATKLATARTINGVAFDGTSNIEVTADPNQRGIPVNTNLDNLTTPGFWTSVSDGTTSTMTNTPFGTSTFTLQVETAFNNDRIIQTAKRASNGDVAIRYKTESMSSFSAWTLLAKNNGIQQAGLIAEKAGSLQSSRTIALSGAVTGSVVFDGSSNATIATAVDTFDIQYAVDNKLTVIPKWDCIAEVYVQFSGWGYGGKKWAVGINTPQGTTQVVRGVGVLEGNDLVSNHVSYTSIFIGLKKGESYLFQRETSEGQIGQAKNESLIAKLYRQN